MADLPNPHQGFGLGIQPDPRKSIQQIHENFIAELASLTYEAKGQIIRDYVRRTMIHEMTSKTQLANQFQIPSRTLCRWIQEICDAVEPPQASVFGVAQGMVPIPEYPLAPTVYRWRQNKSMKDADPSQCDVRCGTAGGCFPCASIPPVCGAI
jgi:hypothetical protein